MEKAAVPKFGSFKPKTGRPGPERQGDREREERSRTEHRDRREHQQRRKEGLSRERPTKHASHERVNDKSHRIHQSEHRRSEPSPQAQLDEFEESNVFIVDKRGDAKNVEYGTLHRYSVPAYHRTGYGHVIGAESSSKIDRDGSNEKAVVMLSNDRSRGDRVARILTSKRSNTVPKALRLVVPAATHDGLGVQQDFIHLRPNLKRKRGSETPIPEVPDAHYCSVEGEAKPSNQPVDEDLQYATDSDDAEAHDDTESNLRQESAKLFQRAKSDPTDASSWLALIEHQGKLIRPGADTADLTTSERRTLADIRLSIYDRALKQVVIGRPGYETLLLGSIEEGSFIWETAKLAIKWEEALQGQATSPTLWMRYLDFVQSNHVGFQYEQCKAAYIKCLNTLRASALTSTVDTKKFIETTQVYVLLRFTTFIRDAGYDELAYAIWQVLLEYYFFKPTNLSEIDAKMKFLEAFWESDVPRIGEESAPGWKAYAAGADADARKSLASPNNTDISKQPFLSFAEQETRILGTLQLPAATDEDSNDPFGQVMFSDLRDVVECLCGNLPEKSLIGAFLCFMQLPPLASEDDAVDAARWQTDPFLCNESGLSTRHNEAAVEAAESGTSMDNRKHTSFSLFDKAFAASHRRTTEFEERGEAIACFVDRVLSKLLSARPNDDMLAEYLLAYQLRTFPLEATKSAKRLLKARSSSLRLYNAYAMIEAKLGRFDKAKTVWSTALSMNNSTSIEASDDAIILWHSWTRTLLHQGDDDGALSCLNSIVDKHVMGIGKITMSSDVSAAQRLKSSRHLEEMVERMEMKGLCRHAVLYMVCSAWYAYLVDDRSLDSALRLFAKWINKRRRGSDELFLELLHQAKAELVQTHVEKRRPYKPVVLKRELLESLKLYPENSLLLSIYTGIRANNRIDDHLRDAAESRSTDDTEPSMVRWSISLAEELRRQAADVAGSTQSSVRSSFAKALLAPSSRVKHAPALWVRWFRFECSAVEAGTSSSSTSLQKARQVFYDGLRSLPWCKSWVVEGLRYFSQEGRMTEGELQQVYEVLVERELRLRVDIDAIETCE